MPALHEIFEEQIPVLDRLAELERELEESGGAFASQDQEQEYDALLMEQARLEYEATGKFDGYGIKMTEFGEEEDALDARIKRIEADLIKPMRSRRNYFNRKIERMKGAMHSYMKVVGVERVVGDLYRWKIWGTGGADQVELLSLTTDLPKCYQSVVVVANESAIMADLKSGDAKRVKKAEKYGRIKEKGTYVRSY